MPITDESDLGSAGTTGSYILGTLNDDDVDWLVDHGRRRTVQPGDGVLGQGRPITDLMLVLEGELEGRHVDEEQSPIRLGPGSAVGAVALLGGVPSPISVVAVATS